MGKILGREVLMAAGTTIAQNDSTYTSSFPFNKSTGEVALLVVTTGNCTLAITQQCSEDNITWYDAVNGSMTAMGAAGSSTTATISNWIVPTLAPAPYIRFKVAEANAAAGTGKIIMYSQESLT